MMTGSRLNFLPRQPRLKVFSLIFLPLTRWLNPPATGDFKQNISRYQALPFEKRVLKLIREAYLGEYPDSYRIAEADTMVNISVDLSVRLVQIVDVEGVGLRLKEYKVKATADEPIHITEKDFLRAEMGERIIAVVVENHNIEQRGSSRVFIVEQRGEDL